MIKKNKYKIIIVAAAIIAIVSFKQNSNETKLYSNVKSSNYIEYTVEPGDCLSTIASKYKGHSKLQNVINEIEYINNINEVIEPGQKLLIPEDTI